jgi:hypothetical protein
MYVLPKTQTSGPMTISTQRGTGCGGPEVKTQKCMHKYYPDMYLILYCMTCFIVLYLIFIMSGRKRKNYDPIDPRNWPKERYIERLKHMGIGINTSWKVEVLRQLYRNNG